MEIFATLSKVEEQDDGTLLVSGIASTESKDSAGEIVTAEAMKAALPGYMQFPAIREMHGLSAAGTAIEAKVDGNNVTRVVAKVVDPVAIAKVNSGTYRGFSIGGKVTGRDPKDRKVITKIDLREISLVDRPCNPEAKFDMWKADGASPEQETEMIVESGAPAPEDAGAAGSPNDAASAAADAVAKAASAAPAPEGADVAPALEKAAQEPAAKPDAVPDAEPAAAAPEGETAKADAPMAVPAEPKAADRAAAAVAALEEAVAKAAAPGDLAKGMYAVSRFADVLSSLSYLVMDCEFEAEMEADGSPVPAALRAGLVSLLGTFKDMAAEEADELMNVGKAKKAAEAEAIGKAAETDALAKVATEADVLRGEVAARDADLAKFADRIEPLTKAFSEMAERLAKVEAQPMPSKTAASTLAKTEAVSKEQDAAGHATAPTPQVELTSENIVKVLADMPEDQRNLTLMKAALACPRPVTL